MMSVRRTGSASSPRGASTTMLNAEPRIGGIAEPPAASTPGSTAAASTSCWRNARRPAAFGCTRLALTLTIRTDLRSKPAARPCRVTNVRTSRIAPTTSTSDSATCATTRLPDSLPRRSPASARADLSASIGRAADARNAGASPNKTTVATVVKAVNRRVRQSSERSRETRLTESESCATSAPLPHAATRSPARPPMAASVKLSIKSCRVNRARPAPSARRTLISCCRADAREIGRAHV